MMSSRVLKSGTQTISKRVRGRRLLSRPVVLSLLGVSVNEDSAGGGIVCNSSRGQRTIKVYAGVVAECRVECRPHSAACSAEIRFSHVATSVGVKLNLRSCTAPALNLKLHRLARRGNRSQVPTNDGLSFVYSGELHWQFRRMLPFDITDLKRLGIVEYCICDGKIYGQDVLGVRRWFLFLQSFRRQLLRVQTPYRSQESLNRRVVPPTLKK
jgi:hypothetical protein